MLTVLLLLFLRILRKFAVSPGSLFRLKKSAQLWCLFRSGIKCSLNRAYRRYNGSEVGSFSLTVFVISVNADCPIAQIKTSFFPLLVGLCFVATLLWSLSFLICPTLESFLCIGQTFSTRVLLWCGHFAPGSEWVTSV